MRILVIDDEKEICDMLSYFFKKENMNATFRNTARSGITELKKQEFDLVLLDLAMPDFSGYDFLDTIKENALSQSKIIVYTAMPISEEEEMAIRNRGVIKCIKKTSDLSHLREIITQTI